MINFPKNSHTLQNATLPVAKKVKNTEYPTVQEMKNPDESRIKGDVFDYKEIESRSGELWECISRHRSSLEKGFIYVFKMKREYDNVTPGRSKMANLQAAQEKIKFISPAVEPLASEIRLSDELISLGYLFETKQDGVYFYLPDREALLANWKKLQEKKPEMPNLDIISSEGIASDLDFVSAYIKHHMLLSDGKEFMHDSTAHLIPLLVDMMNLSSAYNDKRAEVVKIVNKLYQKIVTAINSTSKEEVKTAAEQQKLAAGLGAFVDLIASRKLIEGKKLLEGRFVNWFHGTWVSPAWRDYWKKRFGDENIDNNAILAMWREIVNNDAELEKMALEAIKLDPLNLEHGTDEQKNNEELVFAAVSKNGLALQFASEKLRNNQKIVYAALRQNGLALKYIGNELKNNKTIELAALNQNAAALEYACEESRSNEQFVLTLIHLNWTAFKYASNALKNKKNIALAAIKYDGLALEYASEALQNDREVALNAIKQNWLSLKYASEALRNDKEFVLRAIAQNAYALEFASEALRNDKEFVLRAVEQNGLALKYASEALRNDKEFVLRAIAQNANALEFASEALRNDKEVVLRAVEQNGLALEYASEALQDDEEIVLRAVKQNGLALEHASLARRSNEIIALTAVKQNGKALRFASDALRNSPKIVLPALRSTTKAYYCIGEELKKDKRFKEALDRASNASKHKIS